MLEQITGVKHILSSILYCFLGLGVLGVSFVIFDKLTPGNFWKEILEEHNVALAILGGTFVLAMAQVIASAIHGG